VKREDFATLTAACAKCGTCRTVCTLYPERKSEISVARGKVTLVEAAVSGLGGNAEAMQEALSDCLLCGRCERGCPNQVLVEEIIMKGRAALAEELGIPAWKQVVFGKVMPSSAARGAARKADRRIRTRTSASTTSIASHDRYSGSGRRQATTPEIMRVLMTPPAKMGSVPNRLAIRAERMSAGVSCPECVSQRVRRHLGKLNFSAVSTRSRPKRSTHFRVGWLAL